MSAICTPQTPTNSLTEAVGGICNADSICDAEYAQAHTQLGYLQRASARMILDVLAQQFPPSEARTLVRTRVLDTLAYYAKEVERWASSLDQEISETPSST